MREYMKRRARKRRQKAIEYLGGVCIECDSDVALHFHHKDPEDKEFTIAKGYSFSKERFWKEVDKCVLLCNTCHYSKGDHTRKNQAVGERVTTSKLTKEQVLEIRDKYKPYVYTQPMLAEEYDVSQTSIKHIVNRKTWKHI